jgi:hypothetical protein
MCENRHVEFEARCSTFFRCSICSQKRGVSKASRQNCGASNHDDSRHDESDGCAMLVHVVNNLTSTSVPSAGGSTTNGVLYPALKAGPAET